VSPEFPDKDTTITDVEASADATSAGLTALGSVHLIGIGGAGMSGIARILLARGVAVSGSDAKDSRTLAALRVLGAEVFVGHHESQLSGANTIVMSTAISEDNPEIREARRRGLPVLPRAAALSVLMLGRRAIAVAGTHGKTTTTSLLTVALQHCGADPSFAIGGNLNDSDANAHHGSGDLFVAEADESDGSFLLYSPFAAVVTNVEADHLDHYGSQEEIFEAFTKFSELVSPDGFLVCCADDEGARNVATVARDNDIDVRTYGESSDADVRIDHLAMSGGGSRFSVTSAGRRLGEVRLRSPGRHNAVNAAAAFAVGLGLGYPAADLRAGLASFTGTRRRFELRGRADGVRVFDDYAHHPTELRAVLSAAREVVGDGRLIVAFQPHRFSRTAAFRTEFGAALSLADEVIVMEVYSAGEEPIPGATGAAIAAAVPLPPGRVVFEPSWSAVAGQLAEKSRPGDVVLTLGAGDVTMIAGETLLELVHRARL
jgi:UDP-N-acetylmuramate--alanine ligase